MRFFARLLLCVGIAVAVAGCDTAVNKHYLQRGIGSDLPPDDLKESTKDLTQYVNNICKQTGLGEDMGGGCGIETGIKSESIWQLFVQTGMNDIDRRCDAYLVWLDNIRRSEAPWQKQLTDAHVATQLVLEATSAGTVPMALVATAFGFAADTLTNFNSRLILTVNQSTVQAVVLGKQNEFRKDLLGDGASKPRVIFDNRPAAIHALRSYMRLCMPMTIETEINNTLVAYQSGGIEAYKRNPMVTAAGISRANFDPRKPIQVDPPFSKYILNPMSDTERGIRFDRGVDMQRALCVASPDGNFGDATSETRKQLQAFKGGVQLKAPGDQIGVVAGDVDKSNVDSAVRRFTLCGAAGTRDPYEIGVLVRYKTIPTWRAFLAAALRKAKTEGAKEGDSEIQEELIVRLGKAPATGLAIDPDVRRTVEILRKFYKVPDSNPPVTGAIDLAFVTALIQKTKN